MEVYDVTIIGGGPAGLYSSFYSGLREMKVQIIEAQPYLGGKLNLYSEKIVWDAGGIPPMPAGQFIQHLINQAKTFQPTIRTGEKVNGIKKKVDGNFQLQTTKGKTYLTKTLLLAVGNGILDPTPTPFFTNEGRQLKNVQIAVIDFEAMKQKRVFISGGGQSAIDWAKTLAPIAKEVILVYRREAFKGHESEIKRVTNGPVRCIVKADLVEKKLTPDGSTIEAVTILHKETDKEETILVDEVIVCHGFNQKNELFEQNDIGLEVFNDYYVQTTPQTKTVIPGVFALGDAASYTGKVHLIAGAFHDAINAVNAAKLYIDPKADAIGTVSTYADNLKSKVATVWKQYATE
ncbi:thioredoxin reductase (NADPH) [Carnobacterium iners]|uniref:Ferredoxin--NADP reductase n=1 Tax=Carnobacterium iners TaxID=1073423 RepID=A0A1X7MT79_9LACT|nr:NAD(P)/FAD-dependent oxidoreductase [Carnobacterium iners]SEL06778.1 thioredoxin reductase (NADPH) [Carnobacterium iners]SMH27915.1 thioredoxin reductase (NADPH) [Carnobacterium iners]